VTLNEAYQFAYNETLQRTETSRAGAQHPAYDIQLAGTGDLVMTDLHTSASRLVLARDLAGRIYVRDNAGRLVVELRKEPTYPVELGLEAGTYRVVLDRDGSIFEGSVQLSAGGRGDVAITDLAPGAPLVSVRRGDEPAEATPGPSPVIGPTVAATATQPATTAGSASISCWLPGTACPETRASPSSTASFWVSLATPTACTGRRFRWPETSPRTVLRVRKWVGPLP